MSVEDTRVPHWETQKLREAAAKMKVVIVGAGLSGILSAIRLQQAGIAFEIVEKNSDVGGNLVGERLSGCRVDNPNHMYSFSFEPNHDWPYHFSTQDVLLAYFRRMADKYGLREHIRFETSFVEAVFDEAASKWKVRIRGNDKREETLSCRRGDQRGRPAEPAQASRPQGPRQLQGTGVSHRALAATMWT